VAGRLPAPDPLAGDFGVRISRWTLLWILIVGVLLVVEVSLITGAFGPDPALSIIGLIFALTFVAILSIIGAVFVGMVVSHRVLSVKGFTPFEQEMLRMAREVRELNERIAEIGARLDMTHADRKNPP
jgi:hypothetical protein